MTNSKLLQSIHLIHAQDEDEDDQTFISLCIDVSIVISIIGLVILITAFFITRETKYLHGKSIVCQSFSLLICFLGTAISLFQLIQPSGLLCDIIGKIN